MSPNPALLTVPHNVPSGGGGGGGLVILENFNKANGALGPTLTWTAVSGTWTVASNAATIGAAVGTVYRSARAETDLPSVDHYAQVDITGLNVSSEAMRAGVAVRYASSAETYYGAMYGWPATAGTALIIYKCVAGVVTSLATAAPPTDVQPITLKLAVAGSTLTLSINGTAALTTTDSSITTGTRTGLTGNRRSSGSPWAVDNFEAGT